MAYEPRIYCPLTSRLQVTVGYRFHRRSLDLPSPLAVRTGPGIVAATTGVLACVPIPTPTTPAPDLDVPLVGGGRFRLANQRPDSFTLVVFYRGLHCPICRGYLAELNQTLDDFAGAGVTSVVEVSGDDADRAQQSVTDWGLDRLQVGYGQSIESMRAWGLFVSTGIADPEPDLFGEPGLFLIRPDATVYMAAVNSMPAARPRISDVLGAAKSFTENDYPTRGEA